MNENSNLRNKVIFGVVGIAALGFLALSGSLVENLDANEIMIIQSPVAGDLTVHTDPGIKWQGLGKVTKYPRRAAYEFVDGGKGQVDASKKLRFNDGGNAFLSGAVSYEYPLNPAHLIKIHKAFGSPTGVEHAAVAKMIDAAVYLAGPLMSSVESAGEKRAELVASINDQAEHGVYVTTVREKETIDPVTQQKRLISVTEISRDKDGLAKRQQGSILQEFDIKLYPMSISKLAYDEIVDNQIKQRQAATTQVQIAVARSKQAEQEALTTAKQGEANAAKAKWEQETIKAKFVTEAQQKLEVATLGAKEAEQYKRQQILIGEGDAARKRLVMDADGALQPKLDTLVKIHEAWSTAAATAPVPTVVMGGGAGNGASNTAVSQVQSMMEIMSAKAARDLAIDMGISGKAATTNVKK